jgi:hypothetical protein
MYASKSGWYGSKASLRFILAAVILLASTSLAVGAGTACSKQSKTFVNLMGNVPASTSRFVYWSIRDLNEDGDLWLIYSKFKESADAQQLQSFVPLLAAVTQSARAFSYDNTSPKNPITVFRGDLDTKAIEGELKTIGYSQTSDKKIWFFQESQTASKAVALRSSTVFMGDVSDLRSCLEATTKSSTPSLKEDANIRLAAAKLPSGLIVEVNKAGTSHGEQYGGLVTYGKSYTKAKKDTLKLTAVYLFSDDPAANAAVQQIEAHLSTTFKEVKVKRDGNLVIATSQISISDFAQSLQF